METVKQEIISLFSRTMLNTMETMDSKTLNFWTNAISRGNKSLDDLEAFLMKSQDYQNAIQNTFVDVFYDKIGGNTEYQTLLKEFLDSYKDKQISRLDITSFILDSSVFIEKYTSIIHSVYETITNEQPSTDTTVMFLKKFQNQDYSVDSLKNDIEEYLENIRVNGTSPLEHDTEWCQDFTEEQQKEIMSLWDDKTRFLEFYRRTKDVSNDDTPHPDELPPTKLADSFISSFEKVYQRNMNAREFVLYLPRFDGILSQNMDPEVQKIKAKHDAMFSKVRELSSMFYNEILDEDVFIKTYLPDIEQEDFDQHLKFEMLRSDKYKNKMTERISILYRTMYGEELGSEELTYIFEQVKKEQYDLLNEDMNGVLVNYKNENDKLIERIFQIFMDTYEREPDIHELSRYIQLYRSHDDSQPSEVDKIVENDLFSSLEYHDVIKQKIRKTYLEIKNTPILPSIVYHLLNKTLEKQDYKNIDSWLNHLIQEL